MSTKKILFGALALAAAAGCGAPEDSVSGDGGTGGSGSGPVCQEGDCETGAQQTPEAAREVCEESKRGPRVLRRLTRSETEASLADIFPELSGLGWAGVKLSGDIASKLGFSNDASTLVVGGTTARELQKTAEEVAELLTSETTFGTILPCATSAADVACVTEFVNRYGLRLFRRPLTQDEVNRYVSYHESVAGRSDFRTGVQWTLSTMIQSPHAFYRKEIGVAGDDGYVLDAYERATELAYVYTGSTPDQTLLDAAASGGLDDVAGLRAQAERLLGDGSPRRFEAVRAFFVEWLEYKKVQGQSRVDAPEFADVLAEKMIEETRLFLDQIVFGDQGDIEHLLLADYTAVDSTLATFYGYTKATQDPWERVVRPSGHGLGVLAQASLLAGTSHQEATSPTLRGLLFYRKFLCNSKPEVPDIVPPIEETSAGTDAKTTRQKFEEHHAVGSCGACHKPFEPFGYTLEQFDETGRYRADEGGEAIDTVATVTLPDGSEAEVTSQEDLARLVQTTDEIENCVSGLIAAYVFSGAGGQNCLAEPERRALAAGDKSIRDYLLDLTGAPQFTTRD